MAGGIYLVGVAHKIQWLPQNSSVWRREIFVQFCDYLAVAAKCLGVAMIAEEFNDDALDGWPSAEVACRDVSKRMQLRHLYADPTCEERKSLGIGKCEHQAPNEVANCSDCSRREEWWLEKLGKLGDECVIFVCGEFHVNTFKQRLKRAGWPATLISDGWATPKSHCAELMEFGGLKI